MVAGALAATAAGCGGTSSSRTVTAAQSHVAAARGKARAPSYRVGQYCVARNETIYRTAGLSCKDHHLAR